MRKLLFILFFCVFARGVSAEQNTQKVVFSGSSTVLPLMETLEPYLEGQGFLMEVQGGGSSAGIKSISAGLAQIAMVSRDLSQRESKRYETLAIAKDWIVLIAHQSNPIESMSNEEVSDLYSGKLSTWPGSKNEVHLIAKENGRATKKVFDTHFKLRGKLRKDLVIIGANGQAIVSVANDENALAYVSYSAAHEAMRQGEKIKLIALNGVVGTPENVQAGTYQLTRTLNLVYLPKQLGTVDTLKSLIGRPEARKLLASQHVFPLN